MRLLSFAIAPPGIKAEFLKMIPARSKNSITRIHGDDNIRQTIAALATLEDCPDNKASRPWSPVLVFRFLWRLEFSSTRSFTSVSDFLQIVFLSEERIKEPIRGEWKNCVYDLNIVKEIFWQAQIFSETAHV